jgi:hypothetical protein
VAKFSEKELLEIKSKATEVFVNLPQTGRMPGMKRDLTEMEKISFSNFIASVGVLNRLGCINQAAFDALDLRVFQQTIHHDLLDEEMEGVVFKK